MDHFPKDLDFGVVAVSIKRVPNPTETSTGEQQILRQFPSTQPTQSLISPTSIDTFSADEPNNHPAVSHSITQAADVPCPVSSRALLQPKPASHDMGQDSKETIVDILRRLQQENSKRLSAGIHFGAKKVSMVVKNKNNNKSDVRKGRVRSQYPFVF